MGTTYLKIPQSPPSDNRRAPLVGQTRDEPDDRPALATIDDAGERSAPHTLPVKLPILTSIHPTTIAIRTKAAATSRRRPR